MKGRYQLNTEQDVDEGFQHPPNQTQLFTMHSNNLEAEAQAFNSLQPILAKKSKQKCSQKHSLKLDSLQSTHVNLSTLSRHSKAASLIQTRLDQSELSNIQETENRSLIIKKQRNMHRQRSLQRFNDEEPFIIFKRKREIGQDLAIKYDSQTQEDQARELQRQYQSASVIYRHKIATSTHTYFKQLTNNQKSTFINHKYNIFLRQKLEKIKHQSPRKQKTKKDIEFKSDFQSGNLEFSFKISQNEYNLFLRIDTHTKGHQSWFYFNVVNHQNTEKRIKLNICNLKRNFKLISKGQKLFICRCGNWSILNEELQIVLVQKRTYRLSFSLKLLANQSIFISLIPPYTYSQLLEDMQAFENYPHAKVQVLTYSISGLAIPIITITKNAKKQTKNAYPIKKKLFLISGRIHPSQTCSSYIIKGLIKELLDSKNNQQIDSFLSIAIVKIIPMLNPDGVVFGNFRTSYLGDDLNRSFHQTDESIYPQVIALKQLVKNCKNQYGQNFVAFIDMHGHSCQTNSFVYGPQYDKNSEQFIECRIFPKILDKISKYFSYNNSSFRLQQYKNNTARGHILKKLNIPSYTIETSYALFQDKKDPLQNYKKMSVEEWTQLGRQIAESLQIFTDYKLNAKKKNSTQVVFKKRIKPSQNLMFKKNILPKISFIDVHNQIKQEIALNKSKDGLNDHNSSDSDGQPPQQDLPLRKKQALIKSVKQVFQTSYLLPKAMKPTMILPAIVPSIIVVSKNQKRQLSMIVPKISSKMRQKKFARPLIYNSQFNEFLLKNSTNISNIKPDVINFSNLIAKKLYQEKEKQQKR